MTQRHWCSELNPSPLAHHSCPGLCQRFCEPKSRGYQATRRTAQGLRTLPNWLHEEYYRSKTTDKDPWAAHAHHPTWVKAFPQKYRVKVEPIWRNYTHEPTWDFAEVIIDVFIFAEAFDIPRLRHDVIDRLLWCHNKEFDYGHAISFVLTENIKMAYDNTKPGSKLRKVLVYGWCEFLDEETKKDDRVLAELPQEFLIDAWKHTLEFGVNDCSAIGVREFHDHNNKEEVRGCEVRVVNVWEGWDLLEK